MFSVKLGGPLGTSMGPVMVYNNGHWSAVCDSNFNSLAARVVCRQLQFKDGKVNPGSAFGNITGTIGVDHVQCEGDETNFKGCKMEFTSQCASQTYASVFCSHENIIDDGNTTFVKCYIAIRSIFLH